MNGASNSLRLCRRLWPRRSELMRRADWLEAALLVAMITIALLVVPVALAVGSETYANQVRVGDEQSLTRHPATATLVSDAPPQAAGTRGETVSGTSQVPARWTLPNGTERAGTVRATNGARTGDPVSIWLDEAGNPTDGPITDGQAASAGLAVAMGLWVCAAAALCVLFLLARAGLNRARSAAWQREWARVEPGWTPTA